MPSSSAPPVKFHDIFYNIGPLITIQVENTLFQVPRKRFEQSEIFINMFAMPPGEGTVPDGQSDGQPLYLEGVLACDFRVFLGYLYPGLANVISGLFPARALSPEPELVSVLALAKMWCFEKIEENVIKELDGLSIAPARKLELARTYDIRRWYKPALEDLSRSPLVLTTAEIDQIGAELYLFTLRLKEKRMEEIMKTSTSRSSGFYFSDTVVAEFSREKIDRATGSLLQEYVHSNGWDKDK